MPRLALACLLIWPGAATASSCLPAWIPGDAWSAERGVLAVADGPDGFVYLGGLEGLHRLEGGGLRSWYPDPSRANALATGGVRALVREGDGLWLGTSVGLIRFEPATGRFDTVTFTEGGASPAVRSLFVQGGRLLVGTVGNGAAWLDLSDHSRFGRLDFPAPAMNATVYQFLEYGGALMAATSNGLHRSTFAGPFERLPLEPGTERQVDVRALARTAVDSLWVATDRGLKRVRSFAPLQVESYPQADAGRVDALAVDPSGTLWIGGVRGLARWQLGAGAVEICRQYQLQEAPLRVPVDALAVVAGDRLVVGTNGEGVQVAALDTGVRRIANGEPEFGDLPESANWSALLDRTGRLVLGTASGVYREREPGTGSFAAIGKAILGERFIHALHEQPDGALWIGSSRGLFRWRDGTIEPMPLLVNADGIDGAEYVMTIKSMGGRLLVGTRSGLIVLDAATGAPERVFSGDPASAPVNEAPVTPLPTGTVWHANVSGGDVYATNFGAVYRLDIETGAVAASTVATQRVNRIRTGSNFAAVGTRHGDVFIASENGIIRTDRDFNDVQYVTSLNDFRIGSVLNAVRGPGDTVWFSTDRSLIRIDPRKDVWQMLSIEDGLHSPRATQGTLTISRDGKLVSANEHGVSALPLEIARPESRPRFRLLALDADANTPIRDGESRSIGPEQPSVNVAFATPDLIEAARYAIDYTLTSSQQGLAGRLELGESLSLPQLQPDTYRIEARIVDGSGSRSAPFRLELTVLPHWWETAIVYVGCLILALLLIFYWYYRRVYDLRRRYTLVGDERRRIANELHDTFLQDVFAAQIIGKAVSKNTTDAETRKRSDDLLQLLSAASRAGRDSVAALSDIANLPPLSEAVRSIDPSIRLENPVPITVHEQGEAWPLRTQRRFFLIRVVQEAVNNACKHAGAGTVRIDLRWTRFRLFVDITDDGSGFDLDAVKARRGFGLGAMHRMAAAGRSRLAVRSAVGQGTTVSIEARRIAI